MTWFFVALGAPALSALGNYMDKYLVVHREHTGGIGSVLIFSSVFGSVVLPIALIAGADIFSVTVIEAIILIGNGCIWAGTLAAYLYAIEDSDVVSVVPLLQTVPIFGFGLGYLFLGETLSTVEIAGSIIIIISAIFLSIEIEEDAHVRFKIKNLFFAGLSAFLFALSGTIFKLIAIDRGYWTVQFWEFLGITLVGIILFVCITSYRRGFISVFKRGRVDVMALNFSTESIMVGADLLLNYAVLLAPIALVYSVSAFQPAFILAYALIGAAVAPALMNKLAFYKKHLFVKTFCIVAMIAGSILVHTG